jgi:hypothetical protein
MHLLTLVFMLRLGKQHSQLDKAENAEQVEDLAADIIKFVLIPYGFRKWE